MQTVYLFSGLGADERVFANINLPNYNLVHISWVEPFLNEAIEDYASRLTTQILLPKPILLGVSFGGMMAIEVGKLIETEKIVIISSFKIESEIPFYYKIIGKFGILRFMPSSLLKVTNMFTYWFFGTSTKEEKQLLKSILAETNDKFLKWAISKIVNWKSKTVLDNLVHLHGTSDKIIPFSNADFVIKNGGHFMIFNRAADINSMLNQIIDK